MASYDPRDAADAALGSGHGLQHLHKAAAIPVVSRSNIESECIWERRDRLNAQAARRQEQRVLRASQQVQDVFADRLHQRPLASASQQRAVPPWRQDGSGSSSDQRPNWARPKPSIRMPRSMEVKPLQGYCLPQWSSPNYEQRISGGVVSENAAASASAAERTHEASRPSRGPKTQEPEISSVSAEEPKKASVDTSRAEVRQLISGEVELEKLSPRLRADPDVVAAALQLDGHALQHASEDLQQNRSLVLTAVRENGLALSHAAQELRGDQDVALAAVKQNGLALQHTSQELRSCRPVVLAALAQNAQAARFVQRELLDDRDFVISATSYTRRIFEKASFRLKRDLDVVLEVVEHDPECFMFAAWELRCDRQSVKEVVSTAGCAIAHASPELKQDPEILAVAIANNPLARAAANS